MLQRVRAAYVEESIKNAFSTCLTAASGSASVEWPGLITTAPIRNGGLSDLDTITIVSAVVGLLSGPICSVADRPQRLLLESEGRLSDCYQCCQFALKLETAYMALYPDSSTNVYFVSL